MNAPVAATSLDLRYDLGQDRLVLTARTAAAGLELHLTRRLTRALLSGLLELLMQTSELVARCSFDHRSDVLLFEHLEAVSHAAASHVSTQAAAHVPAADIVSPAPLLVDRIDLTINAGVLRLSFHDGSREVAWINLLRPLVHQFIDMLLIKGREADWNLDELAWIDRGGRVVLPEGVGRC